jgi:uncharacterized protein
MVALGLVLAALIGLSLGLLGGGGSILTVPILVYVLGFGAKESIAMSLAVVGATSAFGAVSHWRAGNVNVRVAMVFGSVAMLGTYLGARLAVFFSGAAQLALFAVVMLVAAGFMFRDRSIGGTDSPPVRPDEPGLEEELPPPILRRRPSRRAALAIVVLEGLAVGVLTGLVGVGGGFLIVPVLVLLGGLSMKEAVGTSLLVIAMKSATGFLGYLGQVDVPWGFMTLFTAVSVAGILAGVWLVQFVPQATLKRAFAGFLVLMGVFILYQNRGVMFPDRDPPPASAPQAQVARRATPGGDVAAPPRFAVPRAGGPGAPVPRGELHPARAGEGAPPAAP